MKSPLKLVRIVVLTVVIVVLVVVVAVGFFADRAVKAGIEAGGARALKVPVTLDKASVSIVGGRLGLKGLTIANPPGYQHETLLKLNDGKVAVNIKSLMSDIVNIKQIKLDGMEVTLEQKGVSGNNLQEVLDSLPKGPKKSEPSGKKLHIDLLELSNVTVNAKLLPIPGKADTATIKLDPIKMENLGGESDLDVAGLTAEVLIAVAGGITKQGGDVLPADMIENMSSTLGGVMDLGKGLLEGDKDLGKQVEDLGKGIEGLKGILKSKD